MVGVLFNRRGSQEKETCLEFGVKIACAAYKEAEKRLVVVCLKSTLRMNR